MPKRSGRSSGVNVATWADSDHDGTKLRWGSLVIRLVGISRSARKATVCCHLANIAHGTGHKIRWDGDRETIVGNGESAQLLKRVRRIG